MTAEHGPKPATACGQEFGAFNERPFAELDMADPDVDGDTLLDGEDDQDNDDYTNIRRCTRSAPTSTATAASRAAPSPTRASTPIRDAGDDPWGVNAFNPCAPDPQSRTCQDWKPFG